MENIYTVFMQGSTMLIPIILIVIFSTIIRQCLIINNQIWIKTFAHTLSIFLLPIITYSVTSVISNNLALSLGLVGALSIVRFRNPVKSPFELTIYFLVISMGICASVSSKWLIILGLASSGLLILFFLINKLMIILYKRSFFIASFSEGNSLNILEIESQKELENLFNHNSIVSFQKNNDKYVYRLASSDKQSLLEISSKYIKDKDVLVSYSDF